MTYTEDWTTDELESAVGITSWWLKDAACDRTVPEEAIRAARNHLAECEKELERRKQMEWSNDGQDTMKLEKRTDEDGNAYYVNDNEVQEYPCGCERGIVLCPEAERLWAVYLNIISGTPESKRARAAYSAHFDEQTAS